MSLLAIVVLSLACFAYIFWPERAPFMQPDKTRVDYLRERKEAIDENLRDLQFEFLAGKYPEADYNQQRRSLEEESSRAVAETDLLTARGMKSRRTTP